MRGPRSRAAVAACHVYASCLHMYLTVNMRYRRAATSERVREQIVPCIERSRCGRRPVSVRRLRTLQHITGTYKWHVHVTHAAWTSERPIGLESERAYRGRKSAQKLLPSTRALRVAPLESTLLRCAAEEAKHQQELTESPACLKMTTPTAAPTTIAADGGARGLEIIARPRRCQRAARCDDKMERPCNFAARGR